MANIQVNPTRMELKRYQSRTATARRGHKLLKDKLDELMRLFMETVRQDRVLRLEVEDSLAQVYGNFAVAAAVTSPQMLREALILPKKEGELNVSYQNLMSVETPVFDFQVKGGEAEPCGYGMAFTSGELDGAVQTLNGILEKLLRLAELEKRAQLLAQEIESTRRRVNALEHILIPEYTRIVERIRMRLEENERENITRLMKIKDMTLRERYRGDSNEDCDESLFAD